MTLLPNVLRSAFRWGSSAVGIPCLMITTVTGAGETWETIASGTGVNGPVRAVTAFGGDLIVGGQFGTASGIARWSGLGCSALGSGLNNTVTVMSLATFDDLSRSGTDLYVGGYFTSPVGGPANSAVQIARWNGAWSAVGGGMVPTQPGDTMPRAVFALSPNPGGDLLYAGGFCEVSPHTVGVAGYLMGYHFVP